MYLFNFKVSFTSVIRGPTEGTVLGLGARTAKDYQNKGLYYALQKHVSQQIHKIYPDVNALFSVSSGKIS